MTWLWGKLMNYQLIWELADLSGLQWPLGLHDAGHLVKLPSQCANWFACLEWAYIFHHLSAGPLEAGTHNVSWHAWSAGILSTCQLDHWKQAHIYLGWYTWSADILSTCWIDHWKWAHIYLGWHTWSASILSMLRCSLVHCTTQPGAERGFGHWLHQVEHTL